MGQVILGIMPVCTGTSLPKTCEDLKIAGAGTTDWKSPAIKTYARGWIRGIKAGDEGSLNS